MQALSQLSYTPKKSLYSSRRKTEKQISVLPLPTAHHPFHFFSEKKAPLFRVGASFENLGGGKRDRTVDLLHAMQALSQLSYTPKDEDALYRAFQKKARPLEKIFWSPRSFSAKILFSQASAPGGPACRMDFSEKARPLFKPRLRAAQKDGHPIENARKERPCRRLAD